MSHKFQPGDFVKASNGQGSTYMISRIVPATQFRPESYDLDNGAVHIQKRAKSGLHPVTKIDRYYRKVN
jgi:hypothetical protein